MCYVQPNWWVSEHVRLKKPHVQTMQLTSDSFLSTSKLVSTSMRIWGDVICPKSAD